MGLSFLTSAAIFPYASGRGPAPDFHTCPVSYWLFSGNKKGRNLAAPARHSTDSARLSPSICGQFDPAMLGSEFNRIANQIHKPSLAPETPDFSRGRRRFAL